MNCSYCDRPLPEGDTTIDDMPNVFLYNLQRDRILALHAECIRHVIEGLQIGERSITN